jgi:hypothetical protein
VRAAEVILVYVKDPDELAVQAAATAGPPPPTIQINLTPDDAKLVQEITGEPPARQAAPAGEGAPTSARAP